MTTLPRFDERDHGLGFQRAAFSMPSRMEGKSSQVVMVMAVELGMGGEGLVILGASVWSGMVWMNWTFPPKS